MRGESAEGLIKNDFFYFSMEGVHLDNPDHVLMLQQYVTEKQIGLIILDALTDMMGGDENAKKDVQPVFTNLKRIADKTDAAIILIHHANKSGGYRGSTVIKGGVDGLLEVKSAKGDNQIFFKTEKMRDGEPMQFGALATWNEAEGTFTLRPSLASSPTEIYSKAERYVMRYLNEKKQASSKEIMANADACSAQSARQAIYSLADKGIVIRANNGAAGSEAIYSLSNSDTQ